MSESLAVRIQIAPSDAAWTRWFEQQSNRIRQALGSAAIAIDHVGSTAVPGLSAKPIIDIVLTVADSSREETYAPALEAIGFSLTVREPRWFEHRMFKHSNPSTHLHVFSNGCAEVIRMQRFRDRLRIHDADRLLYEAAKRELSKRPWETVQDYADAKTDVVRQILKEVPHPSTGFPGVSNIS
jgi:GrpB-like predicted nucleotidyltransferase (UPF0157 family)